jgi:hypothetical protein
MQGQISTIQGQLGVTSGSISTTNLTATGSISALGDVTSGNISMRNLQESIYNLQAAVQPILPSAGAMNTQSYFGANTEPNQQYRTIGDDTMSKHVYDIGGLTTENIQYLQLDSSANLPSMLGNPVAPVIHQNTTGTYLFGSAQQNISFTGAYNLALYPYISNNQNRTTRREQFNLLQDLNLITGTYAGGYTGFVSAWGSGFEDVSGIWRYGNSSASIYSRDNIINSSADGFHWYGKYSYIWRYDTSSKQVIARSVVNMTKTLWGASNSQQWLNATLTDGFITSLGNDSFVVNINNQATYGLMIFDANLTPKNIIQMTAFGGINTNSPFVTANNFGNETNNFYTLQQDQVRGMIVKRWGFNQLGTGSYTSLLDGSNVNIFSGNTGTDATLIYVWSSSQASYNSLDRSNLLMRGSCVTPLSNAKWDTASGKLNVFALCTGAPASPTGVYASADGQYLVPIRQFNTMPDAYVAGDKIQTASFTRDPLTGEYNPLSVCYPLVDIRDSVVLATGAFRNVSTAATGSWREGYTQLTFYTGSSTGARTAGKQVMCVSVCCITGGYNQPAYYQDGNDAGRGVFYFPNNRRIFQDVYGQTYQQSVDATGTYFQQNFFYNGAVKLSDLAVKFYPAGGLVTVPQYLDTKTNVLYVQQPNGSYLSSPGSAVDPSSNASLRQYILNNGFAVRYQLTSYNLTKPFTGGFADFAYPNTTYTNPFNPLIPPNADIFANVPAQPIYGTFDMPDGHVFDSTQTYVSDEWDLNASFIDYRNGTGTKFFLPTGSPYADWQYNSVFNESYNTNYGNYVSLSATGVRDYFNLCQSALASPAVRVLLPGETYTGANNLTPQTVGANKIVFQVLGEVFNGQPIKMTFSPSGANAITLTDWQAKQLNYYGGGIYGNPSVWQDSKGNAHLLVGAGNLSYCPAYEMFDSANYCARKFLAEQTGGNLPMSATTLRLLSMDNLQSVPGAGLKSSAMGVNTAIYNANGKLLFDCTLQGIFALWGALSFVCNDIWPGTYVQARNRRTGSAGPFDVFPCGPSTMPYYPSLWNSNAYGERPSLTGQQVLECLALIRQLVEYHVQYLSNRKRAVIANMTVQLNMKTLQVEQIIRGRANFVELYNQIQGAWGPELYIMDSSTTNADEVDSAVTCGSEYIYQRGKTQHKLWKKSLAESVYTTPSAAAVNVSYNGKTRFACSYDGILGQQITNSLGTNIPISYTYGNLSEILELWTITSSLNSAGNMYLGKQGGKDVFGFGQYYAPGNLVTANGLSVNPMRPTNFTNKVQDPLNGTIELQNNLRVKADGKSTVALIDLAYTFAGMNSFQYSSARRGIESFTISEDGQSIQKFFYCGQSTPNSYPLTLNTGAVGTFDTNSNFDFGTQQNPWIFRSAAYAGVAGGLVCTMAFAVNDLIIFSFARYLRFYRADNGDYLGQMLASDCMWDESYLPDATVPSSFLGTMGYNAPNPFGGTTYITGRNGAQEVSNFAQMLYNKGNLYVVGGGYGRSAYASYGRNLLRFNLQQNVPGTVTLTSLLVATGSVGANNTQTVVFKPQDALAQNSGLFCLLTTFKTTDYFNNLKPEYSAIDLDYDSLFMSGVTAIAIYDPTNLVLSSYQASSLDISSKFVNGGSWYERTGISFKTLLASGKVKFLYGGQIPYKCRAQTPYTISDDQIDEARVIRRQKQLLGEYYRAKGQVSSYQGYGQLGPNGQLPDNGLYWDNNQRVWSTMRHKPYYNWFYATTTPSVAVIYNQPLGFTDVGTGRPLTTPL